MNTVRYSWILPIKNEALSLARLIDEIVQAMNHIGNFEIIAVNDGSTDNTLQVLKKIAQKIPQLKIVNLKNQQGKWAALLTAIKRSQGHTIITLDSDLQDNPLEVKKLLDKLNQGYDIVSGWRKIRCDPLYKIVISKIGNALISILTGRHFNDINSPFKAYRKEVFDNLPQHGSLPRFSMLFAHSLGLKVVEVPINHRARIYGRSKFGLVKYIRIIYDLILVLLLFTGSGRIGKAQRN